ncbi:MAG: hypothetical protein ACLQKK_13945 [Rhodomicrobium sp.]
MEKGINTERDNASSDAAGNQDVREIGTSSDALLIAEYTALKNEQTQRIVLRDTVLYVSIGANAAIAALYIQQKHPDPRILLFIPFASTLLFWIYATNDGMITQIRQYIVSNIVSRLSETGKEYNDSLFGWEYLRRQRTARRLVSKLIRLLAVWFTFSIASIAALVQSVPSLQDIGHSWAWLAAAIFACLPYIFGLWLIDL